MIIIYLGRDMCCVCRYACHVVSAKNIPAVCKCGRTG